MAAERLIDPKALESFQAQRDEVTKVLGQTRALATAEGIPSQEEAGRIADAVRELSMVEKATKEARLAASADYRATTDAINADFNELVSPLTAALVALKDRGLAFQAAEEARAREEARIAAERAAKEEEQRIADMQAAEKLAAEEPENPEAREMADEMRQEAAAASAAPPPSAPPVPKQTRGNLGKLGSRLAFNFEVQDAEKVPERYKVPSSELLKAAVTEEVRAAKVARRSVNLDLIPGVRIFSKRVAVSR